MNKSGILLLFLLCACVPKPMIHDTNCAKARTVRVVRVTNNMILGWTDVEADADLYSPATFYHPTDQHYVYLRREPDQIYYPGQIINLPDSTCIKYSGSYDYTISGRYGARTLK